MGGYTPLKSMAAIVVPHGGLRLTPKIGRSAELLRLAPVPKAYFHPGVKAMRRAGTIMNNTLTIITFGSLLSSTMQERQSPIFSFPRLTTFHIALPFNTFIYMRIYDDNYIYVNEWPIYDNLPQVLVVTLQQMSDPRTNITLPSIKFLLSSLEGQVEFQTPVPKPSTRAPSGCSCNCKGHSNYIPRPKNAFILYRQHLHQFLFPKDKAMLGSQDSFKTNSLVSREIGRRWRSLSPQEKKHWQDLADNEKELHKEKYPGYKYVPRKLKIGARPKGSQCLGTCDYCTQKKAT